ncbi:hypothetical protein [Bacillus sp. J33]|uniref:hypothetical protein n=1 Tax=Bacillus sp. J33 TaxID=935836 RepID=UPI00047A931C|nr:hypothetical protein [Bacillus sp. J33]
MSNPKIYILLTDTGTIFTRLIKLYTKKPYNHASISFDPQLREVYSFGRKTAANPFIGGFVKENIRTNFFKNARCACLSYPVTNEQLQYLKDFIEKMESEKDLYSYNLLGLFAIIFNKPFTRDNAYFCSQFVAAVLQESGIVHFTKPLSLVTPHEFMEMKNFQVIYQGNLENYYQDIDIQTKGFKSYNSAHSPHEKNKLGETLAMS